MEAGRTLDRAKASPRPRAFARHDPRQSRWRLLLAVVAGLAAVLAIPVRYGLALRLLAAWDCAAVTVLILSWSLILRATPEHTRNKAAADDPGRHAVSALLILTSVVSLFATVLIVREGRTLAPLARDVFVVLCMVAVAGAWLVTHTGYTLRYAHLYYRDHGEGTGGLNFPGDAPPAYLEFAYFAFTVGMCFQVSDVTVATRRLRRTVLSHAMLSFAYNTAILATAVNLGVGAFS
jgi:uncharacterized membrane protein